jgi:hypothetical protein
MDHNTEPLCIKGKDYLTINALDDKVSGSSPSSGIPNSKQYLKTGSVPNLR